MVLQLLFELERLELGSGEQSAKPAPRPARYAALRPLLAVILLCLLDSELGLAMIASLQLIA